MKSVFIRLIFVIRMPFFSIVRLADSHIRICQRLERKFFRAHKIKQTIKPKKPSA